MVKKQTKKKFGQEGDGTRKQRWRVGDLLTNDKCSPAVLDFLRNYVGRAAPPVEETTRVTVRRRIWRGLRNERRGLGGGRESFESEGEGEKQAVMTVGLLVSCAGLVCTTVLFPAGGPQLPHPTSKISPITPFYSVRRSQETQDILSPPSFLLVCHRPRRLVWERPFLDSSTVSSFLNNLLVPRTLPSQLSAYGCP